MMPHTNGEHGTINQAMRLFFIDSTRVYFLLRPVGVRLMRNTARSGHRALFTDAAMSVKTSPPYCRLKFRAPKPCFFTDAATL